MSRYSHFGDSNPGPTVYETMGRNARIGAERLGKVGRENRLCVSTVAVQERDGAAQRLWARVDRSGGPNVCWPWSGATSRGYGVLGVGSRSDGTRRLVKAHRLAYELEHGSPRSRADRSAHYGAVVRHRCHNPLCCNPAHLVAGTQEDNILDREVRAGRRSAADT